jgi:hypothetical protein
MACFRENNKAVVQLFKAMGIFFEPVPNISKAQAMLNLSEKTRAWAILVEKLEITTNT